MWFLHQCRSQRISWTHCFRKLVAVSSQVFMFLMVKWSETWCCCFMSRNCLSIIFCNTDSVQYSLKQRTETPYYTINQKYEQCTFTFTVTYFCFIAMSLFFWERWRSHFLDLFKNELSVHFSDASSFEPEESKVG